MQPRIAIIGASGYSGVELTKLLAGHPSVELVVASSDRWVGESVAARTGIRSSASGSAGGVGALTYAALDDAVAQAKQCDVALLATPAEASHELVPKLLPHTRVIDLSGAYRLKTAALYKQHYGFEHAHPAWLDQAVYGLPELYRERIAGARLIANPGCYATAIQLALAPLLSVIRPHRFIVDAMSGVTGAGRKATEEMSFAEVAGDVRAYRVLRHQHQPEIEQGLQSLTGASNERVGRSPVKVVFVPHLLPVQRGILATCHVPHPAPPGDFIELYQHRYGTEPFVSLAPSAEHVALHDVVGTNRCRIGLACADDELVVIAAIDNLVKGAAGQAVQNLNLMLGLDEQAGLAGLRSFHP
jgi:N-acetyl-gamma-glutamyl-phosphate reductase